MGLDQTFFKVKQIKQRIRPFEEMNNQYMNKQYVGDEVAYWRKNWGLHKFISNLVDGLENGEYVLLNRDQLNLIAAYLRDNPCEDIFYDCETKEPPSDYLEKLGAIVFYDQLYYEGDY